MSENTELATTAVDLDAIIRELDAAGNHLPDTALRAAQAHREQIIPKLIETIERATAECRSGKRPEGNAHFYALFLLTEFRATEALPAIVESISLPSDQVDHLYGDATTDTIQRTLATLAHDRLDVLDQLISDPGVDTHVAWTAADAYPLLVRDEKVTRQLAVERLRHHLRDATDRGGYELVSGLICALLDLSAVEALDDIKNAFERDVVDESVVTWNCVTQEFAESEDSGARRIAQLRPAHIEDTVAELSSWWWGPSDDDDGDHDDVPVESTLDWDDDPYVPPPPPTTIVTDSPRVGRNDPCLCGSGRKYKKCCGAR